MSEIRMLNIEYPLEKLSDLEIADIMKELCETYDMCVHEMSTATLDVWCRIVHVSKEIIRRG